MESEEQAPEEGTTEVAAAPEEPKAPGLNEVVALLYPPGLAEAVAGRVGTHAAAIEQFGLVKETVFIVQLAALETMLFALLAQLNNQSTDEAPAPKLWTPGGN